MLQLFEGWGGGGGEEDKSATNMFILFTFLWRNMRKLLNWLTAMPKISQVGVYDLNNFFPQHETLLSGLKP